MLISHFFLLFLFFRFFHVFTDFQLSSQASLHHTSRLPVFSLDTAVSLSHYRFSHCISLLSAFSRFSAAFSLLLLQLSFIQPLSLQIAWLSDYFFAAISAIFSPYFFLFFRIFFARLSLPPESAAEPHVAMLALAISPGAATRYAFLSYRRAIMLSDFRFAFASFHRYFLKLRR